MSDNIDPRDYGRLEEQVKRLVEDVEALTKSVQAMRDLMEQSKGGWRTLAWLAGVTATTASAVTWIVAHIKVS